MYAKNKEKCVRVANEAEKKDILNDFHTKKYFFSPGFCSFLF